MALHRQIQRDHYLLTIYHLALANEEILRREDASAALENYYAHLENKLPLCLLVAKINDPPPPNWRTVWRAYSA